MSKRIINIPTVTEITSLEGVGLYKQTNVPGQLGIIGVGITLTPTQLAMLERWGYVLTRTQPLPYELGVEVLVPRDIVLYVFDVPAEGAAL